MITPDEIAKIIWREHARWDGKPAATLKETWSYKAAELIADHVNASKETKL